VWIPWLDDPYFFEKRGERPVVAKSAFTAFFGLELDWSLRPDPTIEYSAGVEWSKWHPELLNPSVAMAVTWAAGDIDRHGIDARIDRVLLRLEGCPADFIPSSSLELRPCLRVDGGVVATRIQHSDAPYVSARRDESFTAKFGPALRFSIAPSSRLFIRMEGGLDMMLARTQVATSGANGTIRAYRSSLTNGYAGLGVGIGL
jgi:hypothetical protein